MPLILLFIVFVCVGPARQTTSSLYHHIITILSLRVHESQYSFTSFLMLLTSKHATDLNAYWLRSADLYLYSSLRGLLPKIRAR